MAEPALEPGATKLQVYLLGPPRAETAGTHLAIPRRQARALLYRLAVDLQPVPREKLCFLFWPDVEDRIARGNLSRLVSILHRALPIPSMLVLSDDQIGLDQQRTWSDTQAFEWSWVNWKSHQQINTLQQAVDLYHGAFLAGFFISGNREFDAWVTLEREKWERLTLQALAILINDRADRGEPLEAIHYAHQLLEIDELREDIHRRLIELFIRVGDRSAAVRQYESCAAVLERELGVDPLPITQQVFQAAQRGQALHKENRGVKTGQVAVACTDIPLVGREAAWQVLEQAFKQVRGGWGRALLVSGESGIGKSRLVENFASHVQDQAFVLVGAGYPETQVSPYQPLIEAFRSGLHLHPFPSEEYPPWLIEASWVLPELRTLHPGLPGPPVNEPGWARARLFEALEMILTELADKTRPVLLCLDDLHWFDPASMDWLAYLGRRLWTYPLLLLGAYRSEEAARTIELRDRLNRSGVLSELKLEGLDETAVQRLIRCLGKNLPDDRSLVRCLQQATGGNPFFLLETLRTLVESGQRLDRTITFNDLPVSSTVMETVKVRLRKLEPTARQVIEGAAVLGATFDFNVVTLVSGRSETEVADGLEGLITRQWLLERSGRYFFRHELVREAIYRGLGYHRRQLLHRRAGEALEKTRSDDLTALVRHFEHAQQPGRAAFYASQAGQAAQRIYAHVEARAHFDHTLRLLEQEAATLRDTQAQAANYRQQVDALSQRGIVFRLLGDMASFARDLEQEGRLVEQLGDPHALAHLRWRQAYVHTWFCRYTEALTIGEESVRMSQETGDRFLEAMSWRQIGLAAREVGSDKQAQVALENALRGFEELNLPALCVHVLGNLSTLCCHQANYKQASRLARHALDLCDAEDLPLERRIPLGDLGAAAIAPEDCRDARKYLEESLAIASRVSDRTQEIFCLGHLGWLSVREEQTGAAIETLQAALAVAKEIGSCAEQSWLCSGLAKAYQLAGEREQAAEYAGQALSLAQMTGRAYDQRLARCILKELDSTKA